MTTKLLAFNTTKSHYEPLTCDDDGKLLVSSSGGGGGVSSNVTVTNQIDISNLATSAKQDSILSDLDQFKFSADKLQVETITGFATAELQQDILDQAIASNTAVYNQLEVQTDRLLYDTDIIANTLTASNIAVCDRLDKLQFTSGNLHVMDSAVLSQLQGSNLAINTKLGLIESVGIDTLLSVDGISAKMNALQIQSARYTIEAVGSFAPDTVPQYTAPPAGIAKDEGWYYKNLLTAQVSQLYFYSYLNPAMSVAGRQFAYQLNDITMSYCVVKMIAVNSAEGLVTLGIYTRPSGSNDSVPGFFKSRKVYNIPSTAKLTQGMQVMLYWGVQPSLKLHPGVARIQLQLVSTIGPALETEQLAFLSLNTDSASLAGNAEYIVSHAGFQFGAELIMDTQFTGESSASGASGDASSANQISSNTAICSRLDNSVGELSNIKVLLADSINVVNYGLLNDSGPQYLPLRVSSTGNSYVYDGQTHSELLTLNAEIDGVIEDGAFRVVGDFFQASQPVEFTSPQDVNLYAGDFKLTSTQTGDSQYSLDVHVNNSSIPVTGEFWQSTQPVSIEKLSFTAGDELIVYDDYSFQELQSLNAKVALCDTSNVIISGTVPISSASALSVTETNQITGFALETTLDSVKLQTDLLTFESKDGLNALLVKVDNQISQPFSVTETNPLTDYATETTSSLIKGQTDKLTFIDIDTNTNNLKVIDTALNQQLSQFSFFTGEDMITDLRVHIQNVPVVELQSGSTVGITGNVAITTESALDTNAIIKTDQGALTSTAESGTETYNALHTIVKGTVLVSGISNAVSVQNETATQLAVKAQQYGSYGNLANNVASILPGGVTSGIDVADWSYFVGAYEDYNEATVGTISLEYSFNNTTYYPLFNTQIFPSGTGTPRRANISKQDIPAVNWIRLRNGTASTLQSVTVTLLGASLS
jgi:hypothetical protein